VREEMKSSHTVGQCLRGKAGAYTITKRLTEFVYFALYVSIMTAWLPLHA
jgi:hypothetical protein